MQSHTPALLSVSIESATLIQTAWRGTVARGLLATAVKSATLIQSVVRRFLAIRTETAVTTDARPTFTHESHGPNDAGGISPGSVLDLSSPFICPLCVKLVTKSTVKNARQHKAREHYTKWHTWLSFPPGAEYDRLRMQIPQVIPWCPAEK
jgi:hypothetical protein